MKNLFTVLRSKGVAMKAAVASSIAMAATAAHAELPTWAGGMGAALSGSVEDFEGAVGPIILAVAVSMVGIKLFKRYSNKI